MIGTVTDVARCADGTELCLATDDGAQWVCVPAVADPRAAEHVERSLRRCLSLRVHRTAAGWHCVVRGMGHRRPVDLRISAATALGLIERGLPTVVRFS